MAGTLLAGQVADRRIPRMRWVRIVPLLIMINTVSYIDRFNIGYAIAGGLDADLKLGAAFSGLATGVCFWGYFVLQFPGGHWAEPGHAKTIMTCSLLAWSCLTIGMAFVTTGSQLLVMRFITGIAEGAVFPATYTILGNWFPARETGRASALFITNTAAASLIAGPLSGVILARYDWALALSGLFLKPAISLFWTIPKLVFAPQDVGAARGIINGIGNLGGFFGPVIVGYATSQTGNFAAGVFMISAFFAARRRTDALSSGYHIRRKWRRTKPDAWRIQCPGIITLAI